ncbi:MAG: amidase [SAR202 cluster bacterium]|nr:amidase [SAR202 cluster bacterium]
MADLDPRRLTIAKAARAIEQRRVSPVELTKAYLDRIERLNPAINAYVTVTAERALSDARKAEREMAKGRHRGPLHGVPIGLKDLYDTAGIPTSYGAKAFIGNVPRRDSTAARLLAEAGAVLLGKLNTHELAFGVTTDNPHFGATRNPWDPTRVPGGSSGGSAAAVAAGLAAGALGSDTGGSIRNPAAFCGVTGLKPTFGRASKAGIGMLSWVNDHPGPIARTVEDVALLLRVIAGYDPDDFATVPVPVPNYAWRLRKGVRGLCVGVPRKFFFERLDPDIDRAAEEALRELRRLGATLREINLAGRGVGDAGPILFDIVMAEARDRYADMVERDLDLLGEDVRDYFRSPETTGVQVAAALRKKHEATQVVRRALEEVDLMVMPTSPVLPPRIGQKTVLHGGKQEPLLFAVSRNTGLFNVAGVPALAVPCGFSRDGLPISLQIVGRPFDEAMVLALGHAYQRATDWHERRPPE